MDPTIIPKSFAEPSRERSVFGEPDRRVPGAGSSTPLPRIFAGGVG
jgi:hypothetical protein